LSLFSLQNSPRMSRDSTFPEARRQLQYHTVTYQSLGDGRVTNTKKETLIMGTTFLIWTYQPKSVQYLLDLHLLAVLASLTN
jgi:hypothetical protein